MILWLDFPHIIWEYEKEMSVSQLWMTLVFFFFFMKKDITRNILDELIASNVIYVCRIYDKILIQLFLRRIWFS